MEYAVISKIEMRRDTMALVAKKLLRTDEVEDAIDGLMFNKAKLELVKKLRPKKHCAWCGTEYKGRNKSGLCHGCRPVEEQDA